MIDFGNNEGSGAAHAKFDPLTLRYDLNGVPILTGREIEGVAVELLKKYCPTVLESPKMTPVLPILDQLKIRTGLSTFIVDLGYKGTAKVVGRVSFRNKILYLDRSLTQDREAAFRFTAAHEIGHWVLHRYNYKNWKLEDTQIPESALELSEREELSAGKRSAREWLEFQARAFAAALVTPRSTFLSALSDLREDSCGNSEETVIRLSDTFQVSKTCVRIRLRQLKCSKRALTPLNFCE